MMDFISRSSLSDALAPKLEVGQKALYDALRTRDERRATRIIKRVAARGSGGDSREGRRQTEADLNAPDARGLRPIHLAAMGGLSESVVALLDAGVPVDAMGAEGNTALHLASFNKQEGVVAVLMRAGASPTQENIRGKTAVDLAQTETTLTLLCPLHYAAGRGMLDNLVSLTAKGASVNSVDRGGHTPLHAAAATGNTDAAQLLLARGADPLRKNSSDETALDLARRRGHDRDAPGGGSGIIWLLEGAAAEAEAVAAAAAAVEAEKAVARETSEYHEGEEVVYVREGQGHPATVVKAHRDDEEPYYTVRVHDTGRERQTDAGHLIRGQRTEKPAQSGSERASEIGENDLLPDDAAGTNAEPASAGRRGEDLAEKGDRKSNTADPAEFSHWEANGNWTAAGAIFLDFISEVLNAARGGGSGASPDAVHALARAFASVPAADVAHILREKLLHKREREEEEQGEERVSGRLRGGAACASDFDRKLWNEDDVGPETDGGQYAQRPDIRDESRDIAFALADTCRDIVLDSILGKSNK